MHHISKAKGFSLIEIMVTMVISLILLGGAVSILLNNTRSYQHNDDFSRLQENARFALDLIAGDLRRTGFMGCTMNYDAIVNNLVIATPGDLHDTGVTLIDGLEQDTARWDAQGSTDIVNLIRPGTDAITIRKLISGGSPITANMATADSPINLAAGTVQTGGLAAIYDCNTVNIFQSTLTTGNIIDHAGGGAIPPGNLTDRFTDQQGNDKSYVQNTAYLADPAADANGLSAKSFVAAFDPVRYFIADSEADATRPALWRQYHDGQNFVTQELIEGIENMQILYGLADSTGVPLGYVRADQVQAGTLINSPEPWKAVTAIKITLLVASLEEYGSELDEETYDIYGTISDNSDDVGPFNDRRIRDTVSATVLVSNQQIRLQ